MTKRILALLLTFCLMISAAPVLAGAATGQQVSANAVTVTAGNTASVILKAENFTNIAALDVYVYYDASALSVSSTANGTMLSGAQTSVNTAGVGEIKLSAMSLNGISGSGNLLTVYFQTNADCTPGTYPIEVAIGRAYDTNLAAATVGKVNGSVTVNKPVVTETFSLYATASATTLHKGEVLTYAVRNSASRAFVSGEFTVEYDPELFAFQSLELHTNLSGGGAVYSVNSNVPGMVRIAYAKDVPVKSYYLYTLKLTVIADVDIATTVKARAFNVYREDLTAYQPGSYSTNMTLQKLPEVVDHPNAFLQTGKLEVGKQTKSTFCVEAGAGIAAADFTVSYDPQVLRCVAVTMLPEAEEKGSMVIINDHFTEGAIRFSYVNMDAYAGELSLVEITWEPVSSPEPHYQTTINGVGVVDAKQNPITLEYVADGGCIFVPTVVPPTCLEDGYTTYTCSCGESYQTDPTEKLGHDIQYFEKREPTCTLTGFEAHEGCSRCDYGDYVEIPALGHDELFYEAKAPACLEIGWTEYVTCSRCDHSTYQELPALGHRIVETSTEVLDPISIQNNSAVPFEVIDGWYYSANHDHGSSSEITATASYNCSVKLTYSVSSENNYDKLQILINEYALAMISGDTLNRELVVKMSAGDVLTIRYKKDISVSQNDDRGWAKLEWDQLEIISSEDIPAENYQPDCTNGVVCDYCQTEVKPALGHSYETVTIDATCTVDGLITYTCHCGDTQVEVIPATGHTYEAVVTAPTCTEAGYTTYTCHCGDSYIADEVAALGHTYETVTIDPTCTVDGFITNTCHCGDTQVEVIPATGHSFVDGICGACGEADPDYVKPVTQPTLKLKAPALEFKDMIKVIAFFTAENIDDVAEMGMLTYTEQVEVVDITTAAHVIPGAEYDAGTGRYYSSSQGIHAKYLGDDVYLAIYAKLSDGSYVYTRLVSYSPITYASNQLKNSTDMNLKQLVAAMLNYGAAAQNYFGYKTDALANAAMTEEQINLPEAYRADMVNTVASPSKDKQGIFANNKGFGTRRPAVSFEGAFSINYFFTPNYTPVDGITMYYWTEAAFNAVDVLTVENASGSVQMSGSGTEQYRGDIEGIAAKSLSEAVYVAAVYSDGTTSWTSGVLGYSIGAYCSSQATKGGTMADLAMATAVYGYHAKAFFG